MSQMEACRWGFGRAKVRVQLRRLRAGSERYRDGSSSSPGATSSLNLERARRNAGIQDSGLKLNIKNEAVVYVFLDMKRNLGSVDDAIVRIPDLRGNVDLEIVVGMLIEGNLRRKVCGGIEIQIDPTQMRHKRDLVVGKARRIFCGKHVSNTDVIQGFRPHIS